MGRDGKACQAPCIAVKAINRGVRCSHPLSSPMPAIDQTLLMIVTALGIWAGVGVAILIFLWNKLDKQFEDQNKRIDDLQEDMKELRQKVDDLPMKIMEMLNKAPR